MPIQVLMPALSPTMEKGNLAKWHKKEGDAVKSGDVIAEIETDKATMEVEAVDEGTLGKILVPEGTNDVAVNTPIAMILEEGEDAAALKDGGAPSRQQKATVSAPPAKAEQPAPEVERAPAPPKPPAAAPPPPSCTAEPFQARPLQPIEVPCAKRLWQSGCSWPNLVNPFPGSARSIVNRTGRKSRSSCLPPCIGKRRAATSPKTASGSHSGRSLFP